MRLLITAPLTLDPTQIVEGIKTSGFNPEELVATEEFCRAYHKILTCDHPDFIKAKCLSVSLDSADFGDMAIKIRHIELIEKSEAVLVITRKSPDNCPLESEPNIRLNAIASLASKNHMPLKVIEL